ncbi:hypothetical protein ACMAZF_03965 [Psychrobium sp. nBUS_13]|uniref:hypothetical protein n=1 Tax=Psychrobium sp. nBUS_13 TaxID=3395319 RepID=UPI003EBC9712
MSYFELFIYINMGWGVMTVFGVYFSEKSPFEYRKTIAIPFIIVSWLYLLLCVPLFKKGLEPLAIQDTFYTLLAAILSIEIWFVMLVTLLAIALAKQAHNSDYQSYLLRFYRPLRNGIKPLWLIFGLLNMLNSGCYFFTL